MSVLFGALLTLALVAGPIAALIWVVGMVPSIGNSRPVLKARAKLVTLGSLGAFFVGCTGVAMTTTSAEQQAAQQTAQQAEVKKEAKPKKSQTRYELAIARASAGGFTAALKELYQIPKGDPDYAKAQTKIREYKAKAAEHQKVEAAKARVAAKAKAEADAARALYASLGPNEYITNDGYFAALTEELLDKVTEYSINGDSEALARLVDSGVVIMLKPGMRVFRVESAGFLGSKIKIRPRGQNVEVWTVMEAISNGQ